jgi:NAD(P)-dependent dehydrogenase (short-subunit alcohol dehydrogenase family)
MAESEPSLSGQSAVITGGAGGIGGATASVLVADGADVVIGGRTASTLEATASRIEPLAKASGGSISWLVCDALVESDVEALVARGSETTGRVDIAVNVVGGSKGIGPILRGDPSALEWTMRQNITSAYHLIKHAGANMVRGGAGGSIVAVSSMQSIQSAPLLSFYCAAKAGLEMLCKVAADELGEFGVRVNLVRPGLTRNGNESHLSALPDVVAAYLVEQPIRRTGEAIDIAHAIRYFSGPESSWTTGTGLTVDGGTSIRRFPDLAFHWTPTFGTEMEKASRGILD